MEEEQGNGVLCAPLLAGAQDEAGGVCTDWLGRPAHYGRSHLGGWKCAACLLGADLLGCMASTGIMCNLVVYLVQVCDQTSAAAATIATTVSGTLLICTCLGAFLSEAYLGRLWTVLLFRSLLTLCTALISLAVAIISQGGATATARSFLFVLLYLIGITGGPVLPNSTALAADQLSSLKEKEKFFRLFAILVTMGDLLGVTVVTYIDSLGMWVAGFMVCTVASVAHFALTAGAAPFFRQYKVAGNPFVRNFQVLVAACRKCSLDVPKDSSLLCEWPGNRSAIPGCRKLQHTASLSFLDKAAVLGLPETFRPWYLCTVTQVEELKSVVMVIPVGIAVMLVATASAQTSTLFEEQALKMNRQVATWLVMPAASINVFYFGSAILTGAILATSGARLVLGWVFGYCGKQGRHALQLTSLQSQGVGLACSIMAMVTAALVESHRLHAAQQGGLLSVMWLVPQTVLAGAGMNLATTGGFDFFYNEVSAGMRAVGTSFVFIFQGLGNYISSILVALVTAITTQGGQAGWIASDVDKGHLDYFYWLLASCLALTLGVYVIYTCSYKHTRGTEWITDETFKECS